MYIPGRLRTASRPSRTVMELAPYSFLLATGGGFSSSGAARPRTVRSGGGRQGSGAALPARFGDARSVSEATRAHYANCPVDSTVRGRPTSVTVDAETAVAAATE